MAMVPHERSLVKKLEGKSFALLGIDLDKSRENLKEDEQREKITWRSWYDGMEAPIAKQYHIRFLPTIYVLDTKGVIRYKNVRGDDLDKTNQILHQEAESKKDSER